MPGAEIEADALHAAQQTGEADAVRQTELRAVRPTRPAYGT
ncbi:hypothetical protein [Streptomyces sp. NPDC002067]